MYLFSKVNIKIVPFTIYQRFNVITYFNRSLKADFHKNFFLRKTFFSLLFSAF